MKLRKYPRVQAFSGRPTGPCFAIHEFRLTNEIIVQTRISPCTEVDKIKSQVVLINYQSNEDRKKIRNITQENRCTKNSTSSVI
jgi:hypothetical protein